MSFLFRRTFPLRWAIGIVAAILGTLFLWPVEEQKPLLRQVVALDKTPVIKRFLEGPGTLVAEEAPLRLDPYDLSLLRIRRRADRDAPGTGQFTFLVPPSLISYFWLHREEGMDDPATSAISLRVLLPDFARRTEENHSRFQSEESDFLQITVAYDQELGLPDAWHRQSIGCTETSKRISSEYPGLDMIDYPGATTFIGCETTDELPNEVPSLLVCFKAPGTKKLKNCDFQFVVPWRFFANTDKEGDTLSSARNGEGVVVRTRYPAAYLSQWRRMRNVSFCLLEAIVPEIEEIATPSRNQALCERLKQSLVSGRTNLLSDAANGS